MWSERVNKTPGSRMWPGILGPNRDMVLVCLDSEGKTLFYDMMFNRRQVFFYAFGILWYQYSFYS